MNFHKGGAQQLNDEAAKERFIHYYNRLFEKPISEIVVAFQKLDNEIFDIGYIDIEHDKILYHWSCYDSVIDIAGNYHHTLQDGAPGMLIVNKLNEDQAVSNVNNSAESIYEEAIQYDGNISPEQKTERDIQQISVYWFVFKNIASYFSTEWGSYKSMVEGSCIDADRTGYASLWQFSGDYNDYIFVEDPQAENVVTIIPKNNSGTIPVILDKNDGYSDDDIYAAWLVISK